MAIETYLSDKLEIDEDLREEILGYVRKRWDANIHSPVLSVAYILEPQFQVADFDAQVG